MLTIFVRAYRMLGRWFLRPLLRREARAEPRNPRNERPVEYAFAFRCIAKLAPRDVLDVGSGMSSWPHLLSHCGLRVTAIDEVRHYWKSGFFNRHYQVLDDDITRPNLRGQFDLVTCISVLEHIPDHAAAMRGMLGMLKPGGHLILTVPYNEGQYLADAYSRPDASYGKDFGFVCQVYSRKELELWLQARGTIVEQEYYEVFSGEFWASGTRIHPPVKTSQSGRHHLSCILIRK